MWFPLLLIVLFALQTKCDSLSDDTALNVAAFNVRVFGKSKMLKNVSHHLVDIILRYDLILIQEIRDSTGNAIQSLFNDVKNKAASLDTRAIFEMELSPRLGRTNSKEEYAYIYRSDKLTLVSSYTFNDTNNIFEREPFIARFHAPSVAISDFVVAGIHVSPKDAANEISNLTAVYDDIVTKSGISDVIIMGDLNAGCSYLSNWENITLAKDKRFYWLIDNSVDTTSESTECPYDRIVVAGNDLVKAVLPESPNVFRYDNEFQLDRTKALDVSDHYPVEMKLILREEQQFTISLVMKDIYDKRVNTFTKDNIYQIYKIRSNAINQSHYQITEKFSRSGAYLYIIFKRTVNRFNEALVFLENYVRDFENLVTKSQVIIAKRYFEEIVRYNNLPCGCGRYQTLRDYFKNKPVIFVIELRCNLTKRSQPICHLRVGIKDQ